MRPIFRSPLVACLLMAMTSTLASGQEADTARRDRVLAAAAPYIDGETVAIAFFDLDVAWIDGTQKMIPALLGDEGNKLAAHPGFALARQIVKQLEAAGAEEVVVLGSLHDAHVEGAPVAVFTTSDPAQSHKVEELVRSLVQLVAPGESDRAAILRDARGSIVVTSPAVLKRVQAAQPAERPHLTEPLAQLLDGEQAAGQAGVVISMGSDARRVVRELFPLLPKPFDKVNGSLLADDLTYDTISISAPPEWRLSWNAQLRHADAAQVLKESFEAGITLGVKQLPESEAWMKEIVETLARELKIEQEDSRLSMTLGHDSQVVGQVVERLLGPALQEARNAARRNQQMNNFKQIALGLLNFESVHKQFPAATAIVDKEGKPLLSWRVAILPYIEQQALYEQFRLDEPWDSEHNLKWAKTVPSVYVDPRHPELAAQGKTTVMLPVHSETIFRPLAELGAPVETNFLGKKLFLAPGPHFKEITDGTSNTILTVEVSPERAVVWTRPDDWEVDLENPLDGLAAEGRKTVVAAYADGSVHVLDLETIDPKTLRAMLTRAGGEVPDR